MLLILKSKILQKLASAIDSIIALNYQSTLANTSTIALYKRKNNRDSTICEKSSSFEKALKMFCTVSSNLKCNH